MVYDLAFPFVKGGAQRRFYEVGRALAAKGWQVDWLTFQTWSGPSTMVSEGIRYVGLGESPELYQADGKRNSSEPRIFTWRLLKRLSSFQDYDAVWVGQWPLLHVIPVLAAASLTGRRVVLDWWEVWGYALWTRYRWLSGFFGFIVESVALRLLAPRHVVVTDSPLERERLRIRMGPESTIHLISNGVPRDEIGAVDPAAPKTSDIVALGRLKRHKRVDLLVDALGLLKTQHGLEPSVDIIGDGPEREDLERAAAAADLGNVRFHGFMEDLAVVYDMAKKARMCVVTTQSGGGGNLTLLEAYGCGLPVVAFRLDEGIDPDLIEDGVSGVFVSEPTAQGLADTLAELLLDPARLDEMAVGALQRARGLDWETVAGRYGEVFEGMAQHRRQD